MPPEAEMVWKQLAPTPHPLKSLVGCRQGLHCKTQPQTPPTLWQQGRLSIKSAVSSRITLISYSNICNLPPSLTTVVHAYSNLNNNYKNKTQYVYISTLGRTAANLCLIPSYITPPPQLLIQFLLQIGSVLSARNQKVWCTGACI